MNDRSNPGSRHAIAIVGMACRYPDADTPPELLENSLAQRRSFREIPGVRLGGEYFDTTARSPDRAYARQAAVLNGFAFDRQWFRVPRQTFDVTDQAHWLALTVAKEAIDDVRFSQRRDHPDVDGVRVVVANTLTGEFSRAGLMRLRWPYVRRIFAEHLRRTDPGLTEDDLARQLRELEVSYKRPFPLPNEDSLAGGLANTIAGRICNHFDFRGGGYTIDGACASSLLAVADACSALVAGDADMVLAGGVDLSLDPFELVGFSRSAALAKTEMLVYDQQSEGFWPGEGCGFVVLMRYADAVSRCEHIHAVIGGWGVSSDGHGGLTRPEADGQQLAIDRCYTRAGYSIGSVAYFEGHGTGTKVGDTAELTALAGARDRAEPVLGDAVVSSVKANIGHTKAAAGLAGLIRAAGCVAERVLPPTTGCRRPHTLLAEHAGHLTASSAPAEWRANGPRRAGVSAMGFGGINTHVTIGEAPAAHRRSRRTSLPGISSLERLATDQDAELFVFAASSPRDLRWTLNHVAGIAAELSRAELTDLAVELARRACRPMLRTWKAAAVARHPAELASRISHLRDLLDRADDTVLHVAPADGMFLAGTPQGVRQGRVGLVFPGQGVPCPTGGGRHARRFEEVARTYELSGPPSGAPGDTELAHGAVITAELAGLAVLRRVGLDADLAIGHSLGELSALHWAGCFGEATLRALSRARARAIVETERTNGAMAAIAAGADRTAALLAGIAGVVVANINAPEQTVIAGSQAGVEAAIARARTEGVPATLLAVRRAFHSPAMIGASGRFALALDETAFRPALGRVLSTVTGDTLDPETCLGSHLRDQLVKPVQFLAALEKASADVDLFVEVGPGHVLSDLIRAGAPTPVVTLDVGGDSLAPSLLAIGACYVLDRTPTLERLFQDRFARRFDWDWRPKFLESPCELFASGSLDGAGPDWDREPASLGAPQGGSDGQAEPGDSLDTQERVRRALGEHTGLPAWTFENSARMSADLHLNSITVSEIVTRLAVGLGLPAPREPMRYANASVEEIAEALDQLAEAPDQLGGAPGDGQAEERAVPGITRWVRAFEVIRRPAGPLDASVPSGPLDASVPAGRGTWERFGGTEGPASRLLRRLNAGAWGNGVLLCVNSDPKPSEVGSWLTAARRVVERQRAEPGPLRFAVVQHGWGAAGFARSVWLEHPDLDVLVINLPPAGCADPEQWVLRQLGEETRGFREIFLDAGGVREEPVWTKVDSAASGLPLGSGVPLGSSDVLLVTGGGKGIAAECGFQFARRSGCKLLILGRSEPAGSPELANNLDRFRAAGVSLSYHPADVTDPAAVARAAAAGTARLGAPVTGVLHGAGVNEPHRVADLTAADIHATFGPKVVGLRNVLAQVDQDRLKLLCTFSSIIATMGLVGESHYALANDWLSHETEAFKRRHPDCRTTALEWSAWSGLGMGERLGSIEGLERQGVATIGVDDGLRAFLDLMEAPSLPARLVVTGRFGEPRTVKAERERPTGLRFLDAVPVHYPGVELVAQCELSRRSDGYVDDHVLEGQYLFPATLAIEAMAQAATALLGATGGAALLGADGAVPVQFDDVKFRAPIVLPAKEEDAIVLRILALAEPDGQIRLAIRSSPSAFQMNNVEARCRVGKQHGSKVDDIIADPPRPSDLPAFDPGSSLYGRTLFQRGRFQRIERYQLVEARRCQARLVGDPDAHWFADGLAPRLLLGDAGTRDAALHAVQACIPHKTLVPTSVERLDVAALDPAATYLVSAVEVADRGAELDYDIVIFDAAQRPIERWQNVTFRVMGDAPAPSLDSLTLMAPFIERTLAADNGAARVHATVELFDEATRARKGRLDLRHRLDGKPDPGPGSRHRSASYSGDWSLRLEADVAVGCDLEEVQHRDPAVWESLLGPIGLKLATVVADVAGESLDVAATRVWTVQETLQKLGLPSDTPVLGTRESGPDCVTFQSGATTVYTSVTAASCESTAMSVAAALR